MNELSPEGSIVLPMHKAPRPMGREIGGEDGGAPRIEFPTRNQGVFLIAGYQRGAGLQRNSIVATEGPVRGRPGQTRHDGLIRRINLEPEALHHFGAIIVPGNGDGQERFNVRSAPAGDAVQACK